MRILTLKDYIMLFFKKNTSVPLILAGQIPVLVSVGVGVVSFQVDAHAQKKKI